MEHFDDERRPYLDFLRGIAVVCLAFIHVHLVVFGEYLPAIPVTQNDAIIQFLLTFLLEQRLVVLFCFLFGIGLYLQFIQRRIEQSRDYSLMRMRLRWLFAFGVVHCVFIWPGDTLILLALSGALIYKRMWWPAERQFERGIQFLLIAAVIAFIQGGLELAWDRDLARGTPAFTLATDQIIGTRFQYLSNSVSGAIDYLLAFPFKWVFYYCGLMLTGISLFRFQALQIGFGDQLRNRLIAAAIGAISLEMALYFAAPTFHQAFRGIFSAAAGILTVLLVWHWVVASEICQRSAWWITGFIRAGRMSLTLYIAQSLVMVIALRYIWVHQAVDFSLSQYMLVALGMGVFQIVLANLWLSYFSQGPMEWLWRTLVGRDKQDYVVRVYQDTSKTLSINDDFKRES